MPLKTPRRPPAAASARHAQKPWHALEPAAVLEQLETTPEGLDPAEADRRLERHGPNALPQGPGRRPLVAFLRQFHNLLIYVL
ncbi:MAG: cation-transporting P-type ATPase, partial [Phenylobacterium sp.]|nr:cation-transporting P-type ATPase [Phenylobacterium sp.]